MPRDRAETGGKNIPIETIHADWEMYLPSLKISPDSTRMAYMVRKGNKFAVIENGQISPTVDSIGKDTPIFSPDSKHMAYIAKKGAKWHIVLDGKENEGYEAAFVPVFSPDSSGWPMWPKREASSLSWWMVKREKHMTS